MRLGIGAGDGNFIGNRRHDLTGGIQNFGGEQQTLLFLGAVGNLCRHIHHGLSGGDTGLKPGHAGRAVVGDREILRAGDNEVNRPVQTAVNGKVTADGGDVLLFLVAHADGHHIGAGFGQFVGQFVGKGPETAAMLAEQLAVQIHIRHEAGRLKPQEIAVTFFHGAHVEVQPVPGGSAIKLFAELRVVPAPTVGEGDALPGAVIKLGLFGAGGVGEVEPPAGIESGVFAGTGWETEQRQDDCHHKELGTRHR